MLRLVDGQPFPEGEREQQQRRARELGMAFADLDRVVPDPATRALVPADLARELRALPIKKDRETLWIALEGPSLEALRKVKDVTGLRVIPVLCVPDALDAALERL